MTVVRLAWETTNGETLIASGYDHWKIERDTGTGYVEISRGTNRVPIRDVVERYVYSDPSGGAAYDYRAVPWDSDTDTDGAPVAITTIEVDGYIQIADIRTEGIAVADADDAAVQRAIDLATRYIEKYTGQWFVPRFRRLVLSGSADHRIELPIPIIAILRVEMEGTELDLASLEVNNRYLRDGMTTPDDRHNPLLAFAESVYYSDSVRRLLGIWAEGRQNVEVWGIFGFTDLPFGAMPGEVSDGSQVPIDYGEIPDLIAWAAKVIAINRVYPIASDDALEATLMNRLTQRKTYDESVSFAAPDSSTLSETFTLSDAADQVLDGYRRPMQFGAV